MKKIVYSVLATIAGLVLLFSYRTSLEAVPSTSTALGSGNTATQPGASDSGSSGSGSSGSGSSGSSTDASGSSPGSSSGSLKNGSYTGQAADTPYGAVQVSIKVSDGRIASVDVPQYPNQGGRDQQINSYALPQLIQETVSAQSAQIDMVSGATFTSQGYQRSLQSALDQARA